MDDTLRIKGEVYQNGGPGRFILSRAEESAKELADLSGRVTLIYIDPPFGTGDVFSIKPSGFDKKLTIPVYSDRLSREEYIAMMRSTLTVCRDLLSPEGSIYLHIDYRMSPYMRLLMDELFGETNFLNEIVWAYKSGGRSTRHYSRKHDAILFYSKSKNVYFNIGAVGVPRGREKRNNMKRSIDEFGRVCYSIRSGGKLYTYTEDTPVYPTDVWSDIEHIQQRDPERTGFATQKPESLMKRIILASSREGDVVADLFSGSGTTAAVAADEGRRFAAVDSSPAAMAAIRRRLLANRWKPIHMRRREEFIIEYDTMPESSLESEWRLDRDGDRLTAVIGKSSSRFGMDFAAIGTVDREQRFIAEDYSLYPTPGDALSAETGSTHILFSDYSGGIKLYKI